jgi:hypothetical protein
MRRSGLSLLLICSISVGLAACNTGPKDSEVRAEPKPAPTTAPAPQPAPENAPSTPDGALHLGAPIDTSVQKIALADVAKNPSAFVGKKFATTGTVTAVCQHMGCWMEIKDDAGEAHIKMAGHAFFVPKTASGHKARVLATLVKNEGEGACADEGMAAAAEGAGPGAGAKGKSGCRAEAEAQLGRPLAKLELVAEGVELM